MSIWLPLESNPDVLTKYIHKLGVDAKWALTDVIGLEPEMLEWIPKPVKAIIFLFPVGRQDAEQSFKEQVNLDKETEKIPEDLFYMRQITHNACGTVAIIHSVANNKDITLSDGVLKDFLENAKEMTPEERGHALETDKSFTEDHQALAQEGQTVADIDEKVFHHFIALVNKNGVLYELDGRKTSPVKHGETSEETFLLDAAKVCKEFMARDPQEMRFTVMALSPAQD